MSLLDDISRYADDESVQQPALPSTGDAMAALGTGTVAAPLGLLASMRKSRPTDSLSDVAGRADSMASAVTYKPRTKKGADILASIGEGIGSAAHSANEFFGGIPGHIVRSIIKHHPEVAAAAGMTATVLGSPFPELKLANAGRTAAHVAEDVAKRAAFESAPHAAPLMPQLADRYPETLPATAGVNPKTGKAFDSRTMSPEARSLLDARDSAQADMDANGYTPFFDPEQRHYSNPDDYPMGLPTDELNLPATQKTLDKHVARVDTPEATQRVLEAAQHGATFPGAHGFYKTGQLDEHLQGLLGPEAGRDAYERRFVIPLASTTSGVDPTSNLMTTGFVNFQRDHGLPVSIRSQDAPSPTGGERLAGNLRMADQTQSRADLKPEVNPKRNNFSANFFGHRKPSTIDEQMSDLIVPGESAPSPDHYGIYQRPVNRAAEQMGIEPDTAQELAWAGKKAKADEAEWQAKVDKAVAAGKPVPVRKKKYVPKSMIEEINDSIERTHRITGTPRGLIAARAYGGMHGGKQPLYGLAAAGILGHYLQQDDGT